METKKSIIIIGGITLLSGVVVFGFCIKKYLKNLSKQKLLNKNKEKLLEKKELIDILNMIKKNSQIKVEKIIEKSRKIRRSLDLTLINDYDEIVDKFNT